MLNALVERFGGKGDRRSADRVRRRFPVVWIKDGAPVAAQGLEISEKGLLFATKQPPEATEIDVAIALNARRVRARLTIARRGKMARDGVEWTILAGVFQGIAADDWDAIVRFCQGTADPTNKAAEELATLAAGDDDAYRLLPLKVQERIVATLIAAGRLDARQQSRKNPLLRMLITAGKTRAGAHLLERSQPPSSSTKSRRVRLVLHVDESGNVHLDR